MYLSPATAIETNANFLALLSNTAVKNINAILNLHNLFMCWHSKVSTSLLLMWTDCAALHSPSYACTQPWVSTTGNEATVTLELRQEYRDWLISTTAGLLCFAFFFFPAKVPSNWKPQHEQSGGFDQLKNSCLHFRHVPWPLLLIAGAKIHQINKSQIQQRSWSK